MQDTAWEGDVPIVVEPLLAGTSDAEPQSIPVTVEEYPDDGRRKRQAIGNLQQLISTCNHARRFRIKTVLAMLM